MAVIQKRGESYRVLIRLKGQKPVSKTFPRKAMAENWAKETEVALRAGEFANDRSTIEATLDEYIRRMSQMGRRINPSKMSCLKRIQRTIGDWRIDSLKADKIIDWQCERDVAPSTRQHDVIYLRVALNTAKDFWGAQPNLAELEKAVRVMRDNGIIGNSVERDRRVSDDEIAAIAAGYDSRSFDFHTVLRFAVASSFRISEVCRIRWADLDEKNKTVLIRERKHPTKKRNVVVPLLGEAWDIVQAQPRTSEFIFPYSVSTICSAFIVGYKRAGIENIRLHDLRHEGISRMFERGYNIVEVQIVSGHLDVNMLMRYTKLRPESLHEGPLAYRKPQLRLVA